MKYLLPERRRSIGVLSMLPVFWIFTIALLLGLLTWNQGPVPIEAVADKSPAPLLIPQREDSGNPKLQFHTDSDDGLPSLSPPLAQARIEAVIAKIPAPWSFSLCACLRARAPPIPLSA